MIETAKINKELKFHVASLSKHNRFPHGLIHKRPRKVSESQNS